VHPIFGDVKFQKLGNNFLFISNWRRLKLSRLAFMSDVYFSTLSSGFNDLNTVSKSGEISIPMLQEFFTIRVLTGLNSSQKVAEFLMDFKYILFGSLSKFSKTGELLLDKFKPPYKSIFEVYLVLNFIRICTKLTRFSIQEELVKLKTPEFENEERLIDSIGGELKIPGLWSKFVHSDFNAFLNSAHTYVHCLKEPASIYHENVKALKTILEYHRFYLEKMSLDQRFGVIGDFCDLNELLNSKMGFFNKFLFEASKELFHEYPFDYKKYLAQEKFHIPLSNFSSTKASISSANRDKDDFSRMKVHDLLIFNSENSVDGFDLNRTLSEHAIHFLNKKLGSLADICIKEQYGAKREFYVLDISSKFLIKFFEELFKSYAQDIPSECISVAGDMKLLKIQNLVNKSIRSAAKRKQNLYFVNGDCSKWSASELLEAFGYIILALKEHIPIDLFYILLGTIKLWKEKMIQIPREILKGTTLIDNINHVSDYLNIKDGEATIDKIKLEQNFLMGIFNYLSSIKATICYFYIKLHIEQEFVCKFNHLQHSDDYLFSIICDMEDLEKIKAKITIYMKACGITDSDKKTNVSKWIAEFVSLYSLNGHMTYPQIKKTKEISNALTGFGYQEDSASVTSRTSEVIRVGCTITSAIVFHKLHTWQLLDLYSMMPGQRNGIYWNKVNPYDLPVEIFGISDCLPLLYLICNGDPNNFRIMKFGDHDSKKLLSMLDFRNGLENDFEDYNGPIKFLKPTYSRMFKSERFNKTLKTLKIDLNTSKDFWENHPSYKYIKPNNKEITLDYLKAFYSLKQFKLAYMRNSRVEALRRIAKFCSKQILYIPKFKENYINLNEETPYTIREFMESIVNCNKTLIHDYDLTSPEMLSNGDTTPLLFYEWIKACTLSRIKKSNFQKTTYTIANLSPFYHESIHLDSPINIVLQATFNPTDFLLDKRLLQTNWDIEKDSLRIKEFIKKLGDLKLSQKISYCYNFFTASSKKVRAMMTPFKERKDVIYFINMMLKRSSNYSFFYNFDQVSTISFGNPLFGTMNVFKWRGTEMNYIRALCLTSLSIYTVLRFKDKKKYRCNFRIF